MATPSLFGVAAARSPPRGSRGWRAATPNDYWGWCAATPKGVAQPTLPFLFFASFFFFLNFKKISLFIYLFFNKFIFFY
jgi:hypothetical protein